VSDEVEFEVQLKGSNADTWHSHSDFGNALDALVDFLQRLSKIDRVRVLKAFDQESFDRLPLSLHSQVF
jgi:ribosome-associated translation inhibitor RaiA